MGGGYDKMEKQNGTVADAEPESRALLTTVVYLMSLLLDSTSMLAILGAALPPRVDA